MSSRQPALDSGSSVWKLSQGSVLRPSDPHPAAAGDPENAPVSPASLAETPSGWVLELGEAARRAELRSEMYAARGNRLQAWSSRRAAARARRRAVQDLLAGKGRVDAFADEQPAVDFAAPVAPGGDIGPLLARIAAYTLSPR
jgi:hypothetical protein